MENILYNNISNGSYYIITTKGSYWNVCIDILSLNYKFMSNEELNSYNKITFCKEAIIELFKKINIYNDNTIKFTDFDEYNYIYYKLSIIKINNWIDLVNFIISIY
jgi:hypothetical protein